MRRVDVARRGLDFRGGSSALGYRRSSLCGAPSCGSIFPSDFFRTRTSR